MRESTTVSDKGDILQSYCRVNDRAVPYPTGAIETEDHFAGWAERGLEVEIDESNIIKSWSGPSSIKTSQAQVRVKHKPVKQSFGLGPVMGYNFPLNYVSEESTVDASMLIERPACSPLDTSPSTNHVHHAVSGDRLVIPDPNLV
jgi:hypothetical protein